MVDISNVKVDRQNMCIDRNSELGKQFEQFNASLANEKDEDKKAFMAQMAAYAEAAMVINEMYPESEAQMKLEKLAKQAAE